MRSEEKRAAVVTHLAPRKKAHVVHAQEQWCVSINDLEHLVRMTKVFMKFSRSEPSEEEHAIRVGLQLQGRVVCFVLVESELG